MALKGLPVKSVSLSELRIQAHTYLLQRRRSDFLAPPPIHHIRDMKQEIRRDLKGALDHRERKILECLYALGEGYQEHTVEEVAVIFSESEERILQIKTEAFLKLDQYVASRP